MSLPAEIETLLVARDAALEGRDDVAAEIRAMVDVEFERTRHTYSDKRTWANAVWRERDWRRSDREWPRAVPRRLHDALNDPTRCLRRVFSRDRVEIHSAIETSLGIAVWGNTVLHSRTPGVATPARVVSVTSNRITLGRDLCWADSKTTPIADLLAYGAEQMRKPPVYRPPAVSREVYDELRRRGLIPKPPRARGPSKPERRLARRNRSKS